MKHVFMGLSGGMGPVVRTVPIARLFEQSGIRVSFSIYGETGIQLLKRLNCEVWMDDDPARPRQAYMIRPQPAFYHLDHYYAQMGLLDPAFARTWIRNRIRLLEEIKADFVLSDMSPHTLIAAKVLGIPSIAITQSCLHPRGKKMHYWGDPPRNLPSIMPVMNAILRDYRLPEIEKTEELHQGHMDIVPGIPELDPIDDHGVRYAGPIRMNLHPSDNRVFPDRRPAILVYPGRMHDAAGPTGLHLIESVIEAFAGKEIAVVLATSETLPAALSEACSPNIRIVPYFNEDALEPFDLFIHHGGHGSCLAAVMQGVPSLIIPTQTEREFNARQVFELGAGEYMMPRAFTASHLYQLCLYMIGDGYKQRLMPLKRMVERRNYRGADLVYECAMYIDKNALRYGQEKPEHDK